MTPAQATHEDWVDLIGVYRAIVRARTGWRFTSTAWAAPHASNMDSAPASSAWSATVRLNRLATTCIQCDSYNVERVWGRGAGFALLALFECRACGTAWTRMNPRQR